MGYQETKAFINANIKPNGENEITGSILNTALNDVLDSGHEEVNQLGKQASNIKGIFSRESDFSAYNGIRIYDIAANKIVPKDYKVGLAAIGFNGDYVDIILTKDGSSILDGNNYLAELYVPISSLSQDEIQTLTIPAYNAQLYGNIVYYITLNVADLISIAATQTGYSTIFFDTDYINSKKRLDLKSVIVDKEDWVSIKKFDIFIPQSDTNKYYISQFGLYDTYFIVGFKHSGSNDVLYAQTKANFVIPTSGVSRVIFDKYYIQNTRVYGYVFDVEIDWDLFNQSDLLNKKNIYISPSVFENTDLLDGGVITGDFVLSENLTIPENVHLYGDNCSIKLNGHTITLSEHSGIHNIKFYDDWDIDRTIDLTKESGFAPSLNIDQVKGILSDDSGLGNPSIIVVGTSSQNTQIDGCTFYQIGGIAVKVSSMAHRSNQQPLISNCYFNECRCGVYVNGEFIKMSNSTFDNCYYGIYIPEGNTNICNCVIKRCDCGILMKGGGNGMHGQMANIQVAHCMVVGLFVRDASVNLGYVFNGCHFADASIESDECHSLMFNGCRMETWFKIDSGSKISIHNSIFSKAYAIMYQVPFLDFPADTSLMGNRAIYGCIDSDVNNDVI